MFLRCCAFACSVYPAQAVSVVRGETDVFTLRTSPRTKYKRCGTYLFAEVPGQSVRGVTLKDPADGVRAKLLAGPFMSRDNWAVPALFENNYEQHSVEYPP
jgi:hypothetical protein